MLCDALARVIAVLLRRLIVAPVHGPALELCVSGNSVVDPKAGEPGQSSQKYSS